MEAAFVSRVATDLGQMPPTFDQTRDGRGRLIMLPEMPAPFPASAPLVAHDVTVGLRSIRAPKFEVSYKMISSDTIFAVKQQLLNDRNGPLAAGPQYGIANIKLMIGARVLADTRVLHELAKTSFTVMLTGEPIAAAPDTAADTPAASVAQLLNVKSLATPASAVDPEPMFTDAQTTASMGATDETALWSEIEVVLREHSRSDLLPVFKAAAAGQR